MCQEFDSPRRHLFKDLKDLKMILKKIKQIKDLNQQDVIFARIGNLSKLGTRVNEKLLKYLIKGIHPTFLYLKKKKMCHMKT